MMDKVRVKCAECGVFFETWLHRGEVAPAICLGCWWIPADKRGKAEGTATDQVNPAAWHTVTGAPISDVHQVKEYFDPERGWVYPSEESEKGG